MRNSLLILLLICEGAAGICGNGARGGDEVGLEFQSFAAEAVMRAGTLKLNVGIDMLMKTLEESEYVVTDEPLFVYLDGVRQNSIAVNIPAEHLIKINRARWKDLHDPLVKMSIAGHEIFGLLKLEKTGDYHLSSKLKTRAPNLVIDSAQRVVVYERFFDDVSTGFSYSAALENCAIQKTRFESQYYFVYCSYLQKDFMQNDLGSDPAYGLRVYGVGKIDENLPWTTVLSSQTVAGVLHLEYATAQEAKDDCYQYLATHLGVHPLWTRPRCEIKADQNKFYFNIQTQNPFMEQ